MLQILLLLLQNPVQDNIFRFQHIPYDQLLERGVSVIVYSDIRAVKIKILHRYDHGHKIVVSSLLSLLKN